MFTLTFFRGYNEHLIDHGNAIEIICALTAYTHTHTFYYNKHEQMRFCVFFCSRFVKERENMFIAQKNRKMVESLLDSEIRKRLLHFLSSKNTMFVQR